MDQQSLSRAVGVAAGIYSAFFEAYPLNDSCFTPELCFHSSLLKPLEVFFFPLDCFCFAEAHRAEECKCWCQDGCILPALVWVAHLAADLVQIIWVHLAGAGEMLMFRGGPMGMSTLHSANTSLIFCSLNGNWSRLLAGISGAGCAWRSFQGAEVTMAHQIWVAALRSTLVHFVHVSVFAILEFSASLGGKRYNRTCGASLPVGCKTFMWLIYHN